MANPRPLDSIAAIATPPGRGGVGIVRLSGASLASFFEPLTGRIPAPRVATRSRFLDSRGEEIDEGLVLFFPAPNSFTGEDVIELHGHGGPLVMQLVLQRCLELGARLAEPGEFTRRAFLNDKIDLAQAEAVADLIEASTAAAARSAARSLSGEFSAAIRRLVDGLVHLRMQAEAALDFPEEDLALNGNADFTRQIAVLADELEALRQRARQGALLRSGLRVVLAGQPNVGKSSLLNRLAGHDRAIVTAVPGTTRDAVHETIQVRGIPLHIVDTAGLREASDEVERIGVELAWREINTADIVLLLVDARKGLTEADLAIADRLPRGIQRIDIWNKIDLVGESVRREERAGRVMLWISAKGGEGVELVEQELLRVAGWQAGVEDTFLGRERHLVALADAATHLAAAREQSLQIELCAEELRLAQYALARITGAFSPDDLLGEIFSRFCIGK